MTNHDGVWLTIREAAIKLGVSELTIRRRIKDGKVAHRLENGKYYINFDVPVGRGRDDAGAAISAGDFSGRTQVAPTTNSVTGNTTTARPGGHDKSRPLLPDTDSYPHRSDSESRSGDLQSPAPRPRSGNDPTQTDSVLDGPAGADRDGATVPTEISSSSPPRPRTGEGAGGEGPSQLPMDLDALLGEHRRLAEQAGRGSVLAERVRELEAREAQLQETLVSLSNRNGWLESKLEEREREVKLLADNSRRVPWWRRMFGAPATG